MTQCEEVDDVYIVYGLLGYISLFLGIISFVILILLVIEIFHYRVQIDQCTEREIFLRDNLMPELCRVLKRSIHFIF